MSTPTVTAVIPLGRKRILVAFATGEAKLFNVSPYMKGSWYGKLAGEEYFRRVQPSGRTVVWPDGQDIAPHELYEGGIALRLSLIHI